MTPITSRGFALLKVTMHTEIPAVSGITRACTLNHGFVSRHDVSAKEEGYERDFKPMLLELSVLPKGKGHRVNESAAELNKIIDASGLYHQAKNKGTVLEGSWEQLMAVAKKCHDEVPKTNQKFITVMRAVDGPEVAGCAHAPADCAAMRESLALAHENRAHAERSGNS